MTEPTRAVARPPIGSENNQPTWTRHSLESEVLRSLYTRRTSSWWNRPNPLLGVGLLVSALLIAALVTCSTTPPADPLTLAGDLDD